MPHCWLRGAVRPCAECESMLLCVDDTQTLNVFLFLLEEDVPQCGASKHVRVQA